MTERYATFWIAPRKIRVEAQKVRDNAERIKRAVQTDHLEQLRQLPRQTATEKRNRSWKGKFSPQ